MFADVVMSSCHNQNRIRTHYYSGKLWVVQQSLKIFLCNSDMHSAHYRFARAGTGTVPSTCRLGVGCRRYNLRNYIHVVYQHVQIVISLTVDWSDGSDGCGKSVCLTQVVHWGVKSGWTVIHVPSGEENISLVIY